MVNYKIPEPGIICVAEKSSRTKPVVAFLHCLDLVDDFLDHYKISFEEFCNEAESGWMFGYMRALQEAGVESVQFCITTRVKKPTRFTYKATNGTICALPPPKLYLMYRAIRRWALGAYGGQEGQPFKDIPDSKPQRRALLSTLKDLARSLGTYLATPIGSLAREIRKEECSAILCQEYEYPRFDVCVLLGRLIGLPVYASFQGGNATQSLLESLFRHFMIRSCAGVIIAPQAEINRVRSRYQLSPNKIARIFNPMDMSTLYPSDRSQARAKLGIPLEAKVVVCHGRIDLYRKGLDILLEAWQQVCNDRPNADLRLLLVGSGPDANKLRQLIADKKLRGVMWRDKFINDRVEMSHYLSAADVYTLASRQEGFPVAPLEAMTCGLPIVAADAPGVPDILEEGEMSGGIMVPRENARALALALGRILDDTDWSRELGKHARRRIETHFSPNVIGKQLRDFMLK